MTRYGVSAYDVSASHLMSIARAAENAGFDTLWLGEHVVLPVEYESAHPSHRGAEDTADTHYPRVVHADTKLLDPMVALAAVAAATTRLRLATGIYLLPLRHPLLTARAAATLSELSAGRFMLGVGAGWLEEEFKSLGVEFTERGRIHEECISVLQAALKGGPVSWTGGYFEFDAVQVTPGAVTVPLVLGGNSEVALRRAARMADGWFSSGNPSFEEAVELRSKLLEMCASLSRPVAPDCFVRIGHFDPTVAGRYAEAGFENVVFWAQDICPPGADPERAFSAAARELGIGG